MSKLSKPIVINDRVYRRLTGIYFGRVVVSYEVYRKVNSNYGNNSEKWCQVPANWKNIIKTIDMELDNKIAI